MIKSSFSQKLIIIQRRPKATAGATRKSSRAARRCGSASRKWLRARRLLPARPSSCARRVGGSDAYKSLALEFVRLESVGYVSLRMMRAPNIGERSRRAFIAGGRWSAVASICTFLAPAAVRPLHRLFSSSARFRSLSVPLVIVCAQDRPEVGWQPRARLRAASLRGPKGDRPADARLTQGERRTGSARCATVNFESSFVISHHLSRNCCARVARRRPANRKRGGGHRLLWFPRRPTGCGRPFESNWT